MPTWYPVSNGDNTKPEELDLISSQKYNYVRKDFKLIEAVEQDGEMQNPEHWEWQEMKIEKNDWALFSRLMDHDEALDDVYAALTELAEIIAE